MASLGLGLGLELELELELHRPLTLLSRGCQILFLVAVL